MCSGCRDPSKQKSSGRAELMPEQLMNDPDRKPEAAKSAISDTEIMYLLLHVAGVIIMLLGAYHPWGWWGYMLVGMAFGLSPVFFRKRASRR